MDEKTAHAMAQKIMDENKGRSANEQFSEILQGHTPLDYTKESVKLTRNSKGFTWEIKTIGTKEDCFFSDDDLKRLKELEQKLFDEYGGKE